MKSEKQKNKNTKLLLECYSIFFFTIFREIISKFS